MLILLILTGIFKTSKTIIMRVVDPPVKIDAGEQRQRMIDDLKNKNPSDGLNLS